MKRGRWALAALLSLWAIGGCIEPPLRPVDSHSGPVSTCYEDQPCWDCHTMGNQICGTSEQP